MSATRETLSPLIRSNRARRLSLEFCSQLLSPSRLTPLSNEARALAATSPTPKSPGLAFFQNSQFLSILSPKNTGARRGSLSSITPPTKSVLDFIEPSTKTGDNETEDDWAPPKTSEYRRGSWCIGGNYGKATSSPHSSYQWINSNQTLPTINVEEDIPNQNETEKEDSRPQESVQDMAAGEDENNNVNLVEVPTGEQWDATDNWVEEEYSQPVLDKIKILNKRCKKFDNDEQEYKYISRKYELQIIPNEILGRGSFGTVLAGFYKGKPVAAKIVSIRTANQMESFQNEKNALDLPWHPNVVEVLQVLEINPMKGIVILEKLEKGNLLTKLNSYETDQLPTEFYYRAAVEIASALSHCHSNGILHLDVKPQNILLGQYSECKLTDFGSSKKLGDLYLQSNYSKLDGTVAYKAPELFCGVRPTDKCDVYSFGITLWHIITHQMPYPGENEHSMIFKVVAKGIRPKTGKSEDNSELSFLETKFKDLYEQCWDQNSELRPSMQSITEYLSNMQI